MGAFLASAASAQQDDGGYRIGSFRVAPTLSAATTYDSNLFRTATRPTGSMMISLAPEVVVASDWGRHAAKLELGGEAGFFTNSNDDNFLDVHARLAGEIDITRNARLSLSVTALRGHNPRGADDLPAGAAEPVIFASLDITLGGEFRVGRFRLAPFAAWRRIDFDDIALTGGGIADQDGRDRREIEAGLEAAYRTGQAWELFVRTGLFEIDYRLPASIAGPARDARGLAALGGVRLRFTDLIRGRVAAGLTLRDHADPALADVTTFTAEADLDWRPTRRLTALLELDREIAETAVPGAAARITSTAGLAIEYELLRTLSVGAGGQLTLGQFKGIARSDRTFAVRLGADWSPVRGLHLLPEYRFATRRSDVAGARYAGHLFALAATYRFGAIE